MTNPDVSDLKRKLAEAYSEIAQIAGGLAHEIRNPLSTIKLNVELLAEDFAAAETPRDKRALTKIRVVERECQRLQDLLDDFLNFAKAGRLELEPSDLNEQVRQVLDFLAPQSKEAQIEVACYLAPDLPMVMLDRKAFRGAFLNLVLNAQQAMSQGGQLVARTYHMADAAAIDLIDTGSGMDQNTLGQIFKAFFSTRRGGTGLGLPTTRKIIEAHGGTITCQSEVGRGTQFTIKFPLPARIPTVERSQPIELPAGR